MNRMLSHLAALACALLFGAQAYAQGTVQQVGPVTPGDAVVWSRNGQVSDGGATAVASTGSYNWTGKQTFGPSTTTSSAINIVPGAAPILPINGDIWATSTGLYAEINNVPINLATPNLAASANTIFAAPNGSAGTASFRSAVPGDFSLGACVGYFGATVANTAQCVVPRKLTNAIDAGLDATGASAISSSLQTLVNAGTGVYFPCGNYLFNSTVNITNSNIAIVGESAACVNFRRSTNFGAMLNFANASSPVTNIRLSGVTIVDLSAVNNVAGYSTCATSPFHVLMDWVQYSVVDDVRFAMGCGGLSLKGGYNVWIGHTQYFFQRIGIASGENNLGTALAIGYTSNANASAAPQSANIWVQNADIECGASVTTAKCNIGYDISGVDGIFASQVHSEFASAADFHYGNSASQLMLNIFCAECFADVTPGIGLKMDGTSNIENMQFSGTLDSAEASATSIGVQLSGSGGLTNGFIDATIRGWGLQGISLNASNTANVVIRPRSMANNNFSSTANTADIDISQGTNFSITGGVLDGFGGGANRTSYGVQFGAGVTGGTVTGVTIRRHSSIAMNVQSGTTNVNVIGGDFTGNTVNGIQVLGAPGTVSATGVLGVPWFVYTPTIGCSTGTLTTLGAVAGSYQVSGKNLKLQIAIPITTNGTCAGYLTATLPTGLLTASGAAIVGRDTGTGGKTVVGTAAASGASALGITNYDNSYPGSSGAAIVLQGDIQIQ